MSLLQYLPQLNEFTDVKIESINLMFCCHNTQKIIEASPVNYVRKMQLHGSLFEEGCTSGAISAVYTEFYVDHKETLCLGSL